MSLSPGAAYVGRYLKPEREAFAARVAAAADDAALKAIADSDPEHAHAFAALSTPDARRMVAVLGAPASRTPEPRSRAPVEAAEDAPVYRQPEVMKAMEMMQRDFAVVSNRGEVEIMAYPQAGAVPTFYSAAAFRLLFKHLKVPVIRAGKTTYADVTELWLNFPGRTTFTGGIVFEPDSRKAPPRSFNIWTGYPITARKGSWQRLREHLRDNICGGNEDHFIYLMTWVADIYQHPGRKLGTSVAVRGPKGVGKSKFFDWVRKGLGAYAIKVSRSDHLVGRFNSHHFAKTLIVCEEAFWAGSHAAGNVLKDLITSNEANIERKGYDVLTCSNYSRLAFVSNESWVVPSGFDDDERRFFVLECQDNGQKRDAKFFAAIDEEMENGGLEAMVHEFMRWKPPNGDWSILRHAPATEARRLQAIESLPTDEQFFKELIENGGCEEDLRLGLPEIVLTDDANDIVVSDLRKHFDAFFARRKIAGERPPSSHRFCVHVKTWLLSDGQGHSIWIDTGAIDRENQPIRRKARVYRCPPLSEIIAANRARGVVFSGIATTGDE